MTTAVANAIAITLDKGARASFDAANAREDGAGQGAAAQRAVGQSPDEYRATLARLGIAAPAAVKVH